MSVPQNTAMNLNTIVHGIYAHQRGVMRFGAIRPKWQRTFSELGTKSFRLYYGHP
jgi:hypothetical protein